MLLLVVMMVMVLEVILMLLQMILLLALVLLLMPMPMLPQLFPFPPLLHLPALALPFASSSSLVGAPPAFLSPICAASASAGFPSLS